MEALLPITTKILTSGFVIVSILPANIKQFMFDNHSSTSMRSTRICEPL